MNNRLGMNKRGLRYQLLYRMFVGVALVSVILILFVVYQLQKGLGKEHGERLVSLTENLAAGAEYGFITADTVILQNLLKGIKKQDDVIYAAVVETTGGEERVLSEYRLQSFTPPPLKNGAKEKTVITYGHPLHESVSETVVPLEITSRHMDEEGFFTGEASSAAATGAGGKKRIGYVRLCVSMKKELAYIHTLVLKMFIFIAAAFILYATYTYHLLTKEVINPVGEFIKGVQEVGSGNLGFRVEVKSESEIGELAAAFNDAVNNRRLAEEEIVRHRSNLEKLVVERTEQLQESEERLKKLSDATYEGIIIHDQGIILDINGQAAQMHGYSVGEVIGQNGIEIFIHPDYRKVAREKVTASSEGSYEIMSIRKDGSVFPAEIRGRKIHHKGRNVRVTIIRDITERKRAEEALKEAKEKAEEATKLKDQFVTIVSHDLKSPLSSIYGALRMLNDGRMSAKEMVEKGLLPRMFESTGRLLSMIDKLLDHSRLRSGKIIPRKTALLAREIAAIHIHGVELAASQKKISLRNELPEDMRIFADPALFGQALQNLLTNAVKFTPEGGSISVFAPQPGKPVIAVRDTGVGVLEEMVENIFTNDVRTTTLGTYGEMGTGLGLPYAYDIMLAHGGTLSVESRPGIGSVFTATLPERGQVVLVVDDQEIHRETMKELIGSLGGIEVLEAGNGKEALEMFRHVTPALIITDIQMPEMDGFGLVTMVKGSPQTKMVPVIVVTSLSGVEARDNALRLGASDFVNKPVIPADFLSLVKRHLGL